MASFGDIGPFGMTNRYSVRREFDGATVFVTGATGFIGSLVTELLLRTTNVARVYVLARGKRGAPPRERVARLLHSGLFHSVRDDPATLAKVTVLEGDLTDEGICLEPDVIEELVASCNFVVHAASIIELEADVQRSLRGNYLGTKRLLVLASRMRQLRGFVAVSSAHANVHFPPGSCVDEAVYPLAFGAQEVDHALLVEDLLSLAPEAADARAQMYLSMWGFPNTYTLGKNLTEKLLAQYHAGGLPVAIVRPSMVTGVAGAPYPGYSGSLAGPGGLALAQAVGLFDTLDSVATHPTNVWDIVPGDQVAAAVVAAAAATAARVHIDGYAAEGVVAGSAVLAGLSLGVVSPVPGAGALRIPSTSVTSGGGPGGVPGGEGGGPPLVVHVCTSTTYPISFVESQWAALEFISRNPPPFRLPGAELFKVPLDFRPNPEKVAARKRATAWKVWFAVKLLEALGQHKTARRLTWGHVAWAAQNSPATDRNLFFGTRNLLALEAALDPAEASDYPMVWTLRRGGWPRYVATALAGMYRLVFGATRAVGIDHDFEYIPPRAPPLLRRRKRGAKGAAAAGQRAAAAAAAVAAAGGDGEAVPLLNGQASGGSGNNVTFAAGASSGDDDASSGPGPSAFETSAAAAAAAAGANGAAPPIRPSLSAVREEDGASGVAYYDEDSEDGTDGAGADPFHDPMMATGQGVLATCATLPASGARSGGYGGVVGANGGGNGGNGGGEPSVRAGDLELAAAPPPAPVGNARGVLRVAAVALGRTLSYRPSTAASLSLDRLDLGGAGRAGSFVSSGTGAGHGGLTSPARGPSAAGYDGSLGARASGGGGALVKSASVRAAGRAAPYAGLAASASVKARPAAPHSNGDASSGTAPLF